MSAGSSSTVLLCRSTGYRTGKRKTADEVSVRTDRLRPVRGMAISPLLARVKRPKSSWGDVYWREGVMAGTTAAGLHLVETGVAFFGATHGAEAARLPLEVVLPCRRRCIRDSMLVGERK